MDTSVYQPKILISTQPGMLINRALTNIQVKLFRIIFKEAYKKEASVTSVQIEEIAGDVACKSTKKLPRPAARKPPPVTTRKPLPASARNPTPMRWMSGVFLFQIPLLLVILGPMMSLLFLDLAKKQRLTKELFLFLPLLILNSLMASSLIPEVPALPKLN